MSAFAGIVAAQHHLNPPDWAKPVHELDPAAIECQTEALPTFWVPAPIDGYDPDDFVPVMNLAWIVPGQWVDAYEINYRLAPLPIACCAFEDEETNEVHIGLTGGGMDMSWHIAAAFMVAGYLPPAMATRLPWENHATPLWSWVVRGCIETERRVGGDPRVRRQLRSLLKRTDVPRKGAVRPGRW